MRRLLFVYLSAFASVASAAAPQLQPFASVGDGKTRSVAVAAGPDGGALLGIELTAATTKPESRENAGIELTPGQHAAAVAAYSSGGRLRWSRALIATAGVPTLRSIASASDGSSCAVGSYAGAAAVPGAALLGLRAAGATDAFVLRLGADGAPRWLAGFGGAAVDSAEATLIAPDGGCYVAGSFRSMARFGDKSLRALGGADAYLLRLNAAGKVLWAVAIGGKGDDGAVAMAAAPDSGVYLLLRYTQSLNLATRDGSRDFSAAGGDDALLAHFNSDGDVQTAIGIGSEKPDHFTAVASAAADVAVVGYYSGNQDLRVGAQNLPLHSQGGADGLVLRLDSSLKLQTQSSFGGGSGMLLLQSATFAPDGRLWAAGAITGTLQIGKQTLRANRTDGVLLGLDADPHAAPRVAIFGGDGGQQLFAAAATRDAIYAAGVTSNVSKSEAEREADEQHEREERTAATVAAQSEGAAARERAQQQEEEREAARARSQAVLVRHHSR